MKLLADALPTEVTPAIMGMAVIILLQLSQFFFALRKDMRSNEAAKKEDLTELRNELMDEIDDVSREVSDLKDSIEKKMEVARVESAATREAVHTRITDTALKTSSLMTGQETMNQTLISLASKVDRILLNSGHR